MRNHVYLWIMCFLLLYIIHKTSINEVIYWSFAKKDGTVGLYVMAEDHASYLLQRVVASMMRAHGFDTCDARALSVLADVARRYFEALGKNACFYSELEGRTRSNLLDFEAAIAHMGGESIEEMLSSAELDIPEIPLEILPFPLHTGPPIIAPSHEAYVESQKAKRLAAATKDGVLNPDDALKAAGLLGSRYIGHPRVDSSSASCQTQAPPKSVGNHMPEFPPDHLIEGSHVEQRESNVVEMLKEAATETRQSRDRLADIRCLRWPMPQAEIGHGCHSDETKWGELEKEQ
eukprot:GHVR01140564.1.p1 GENE.GHVR01140564.1~~GHVR01140564.1.p1  ORF type:complete len:290 (-),score=28.16 GHVR01140564.1:780-1649(-)